MKKVIFSIAIISSATVFFSAAQAKMTALPHKLNAQLLTVDEHRLKTIAAEKIERPEPNSFEKLPNDVYEKRKQWRYPSADINYDSEANGYSFQLNGSNYHLKSVGFRKHGEYDRDVDYVVQKNGVTIYTFTARALAVDSEIKAFYGHGRNWIVEFNGNVVVSGQNLNELLHYKTVFFYRFVHDKPFFFFERDGESGLNYDGKEELPRYDRIIHDECCSYAALNPSVSKDMVLFYGTRNGQWLYVEAGVFR